jgi:hypothetical protein
VILQPGCIVGSDGYGYVTNAEHRHEKIPQVGGVVLGDDVEIGSCTTVDRGRFADTRIGRGTKIDNLVQVAHNVVIGEDCLLVAHCGVAGRRASATLIKDVCPDLKEQLTSWNTQTIETAIKLYQERVKLGSELCTILKALHDGPTVYDAHEIATWLTAEARIHLVVLLSELKNLTSFTHDAISETLKQFCKNQNIKLVAIAQPLRIALTGGTSSPGVFDLLALLGKETVIKRIELLLQV